MRSHKIRGSCDENERGLQSLISKRDWIELLLFKKFSSGHLTRTQEAADPSEESIRNHPAWIVKCKFKDFRASWRYAFNILLICG